MTPVRVMLLSARRRALPVTVTLEAMVAAALVTVSSEPSFRLYFQPEGMSGAPYSSRLPPLLTVNVLAGVTPAGTSEVPGVAKVPKAKESVPPLTTKAPSETAAETTEE